MFDPMVSGDPFQRLLELAPFALGFIGWLIGMYWIYRITKNIEDN